MEKRFNLNTILLALLTFSMTLLGWTLKRNVDSMDRKLDTMMPRQEIDLQMKMLEQNDNRLNIDILDFRARLTKLEIDVARMNKP